jgi:hypothetical protein
MVLTVGLTMLAGPAAYAILGATAPAWAVTALAAGMAGTGTALLGGSSLGDSLKAGLTSAVVAGVGSAAYSGISGGGVNAPYTGPKSYGELFETTQPAAPIEDATSRARFFPFFSKRNHRWQLLLIPLIYRVLQQGVQSNT